MPNTREQDSDLIDFVLCLPDLTAGVRGVFESIQKTVTNRGKFLSERQRRWAQALLDRSPKQRAPTGYANLWSSGRVQRGREVQLRTGPLPKRPPGGSSTNSAA